MKDTFGSSIELLRSSKRTILLVTTAIILTLIIGMRAGATISIWLSRAANWSVLSLGALRTQGVEVYWDSNLENKTKRIDWGTISPGMSEDKTLFVRSISNVETTLELRTTDWTFRDSDNIIVAGPSESSPYMNLTWAYNETIVSPGETVKVTLTLSADLSPDFVEFLIANDVKEFSLDIIINASEYRS